MTWAVADDVTSRWVGSPIPATDDKIDMLIGDVEDSILAEFPDIQQRITDAATPPTPPNPRAIPKARVVKVVARVVIRYLHNPDGSTSGQMIAGPFRKIVAYSGDAELCLTDEDRAELASLGPLTNGQKAFTVDAMPVVYP